MSIISNFQMKEHSKNHYKKFLQYLSNTTATKTKLFYFAN